MIRPSRPRRQGRRPAGGNAGGGAGQEGAAGRGAAGEDATGRGAAGRPGDRGQSTAELVLLMPVLVALLLALVQIGLLVRVRVMVTHAAREAVREAAVGADDDDVRAAAAAAGDLDPRRLEVSVSRAGERVAVEVRYRDPTEVPIVGALLADARFDARATMRLEE